MARCQIQLEPAREKRFGEDEDQREHHVGSSHLSGGAFSCLPPPHFALTPAMSLLTLFRPLTIDLI